MRGKFNFCFLELSGIFFPNIFNLQLVESVDAELMDREGQLYNGKNEVCFTLYLKHTIWQLCGNDHLFSSVRRTTVEWKHLFREQQPSLITTRKAIFFLGLGQMEWMLYVSRRQQRLQLPIIDLYRGSY